MKRFNSIPIAILLFAVLLVSAGAYFHNLDAHSTNMATVDARPVAVAEPVCEIPVCETEVVLPEAAVPTEMIPGVNAPTPAPMIFRPQPSGQVVCVEVEVEQMVSSGSN